MPGYWQIPGLEGKRARHPIEMAAEAQMWGAGFVNWVLAEGRNTASRPGGPGRHHSYRVHGAVYGHRERPQSPRQPPAHSNRLTMLWYFSMYQRFSLLYLGIDTALTSVPSVFQIHGQRTEAP